MVKILKQVASETSQEVDQKCFKETINKKLVKAMAHPGEAVGLVCAQVD